MWTRMMCFVLFFVLVEINAGTVKITDLGAIFEAGDYKVRISKNICWTIREITFKNTKLMRDCPGAYNGSVLKTRLKESGKVDWVGTGHGHEVVESVKLLIDGKVQPIKNGTVYSGNKFCFIKNSDLRVLKLNATMIIADSGIIEKHKYTVVRNSPDISLLYIFMHSFDVNMKEWLVKKTDGALMSGNFKGDAREPFKGNIKWVGLYNPAAETGVLYMLEPPLDKAVHFFWDRAYDRKLYFRGRLGDIKISKKNNRFEYLVKIVGFESQAVDWKEKASSIAGFSQGG